MRRCRPVAPRLVIASTATLEELHRPQSHHQAVTGWTLDDSRVDATSVPRRLQLSGGSASPQRPLALLPEQLSAQFPPPRRTLRSVCTICSEESSSKGAERRRSDTKHPARPSDGGLILCARTGEVVLAGGKGAREVLCARRARRRTTARHATSPHPSCPSRQPR